MHLCLKEKKAGLLVHGAKETKEMKTAALGYCSIGDEDDMVTVAPSGYKVERR